MSPYQPTPLSANAHKGQAGRVLSLAGSRLMPGAALLVARAAGRSGAGLVSTACRDEVLLELLPMGFPEGILLDLTSGVLRAEWVLGCHALLAGPGLGSGTRGGRLVQDLLELGAGLPRVLDADALNVFEGRPRDLREAAGPLVITPHAGEARRLLGRRVPSDAEGRLAFARELSLETGALVCLKGAGTVISDGERALVNQTGNPGMATAGSGDVLAGVLLGLLGRATVVGEPFDLLELCAFGVRVHGRAGDLAAERLGQRSLLASDLIEALPEAFLEVD